MVKVNYVKNENQELVTNPYRLVDLIKCCEQEYSFVVLTTKKQVGDENTDDPALAVYLKNNSEALYLQHCINCGKVTEFEEITDKLSYIKNKMKELEELLQKDYDNELVNSTVSQLNQILLEQVKTCSRSNLLFAPDDNIIWFKEALDQYYDILRKLVKIL